MSAKDAVRAAQVILRERFPALEVDGDWGPQTEKAFQAAPHIMRLDVIKTVADNGYSLNDIQADAAKKQRTTTPAWEVEPKRTVVGAQNRAERQAMLPIQGDMVQLIRETAIRENVPVDTALTIAWLESKFKPDAESPTHAKGLFQMTTIATKDVLQRGGFDLRGKEFDPVANATAGMRYIKLVARDLRVALTDKVNIYMGFNIGPTGARLYQAGNVTDSVRKLINQQAYGPPDKYGTRLAAAVNSAPALA